MRSVMISLTIILFCLIMGIANTAEADYQAETNRSLFGWTAQPFMDADDLGKVKDTSAFNSTLYDISTPSQNPLSTVTVIIDTMWSAWTLLVAFVTFFVDTMIKSSIGFGSFIQTLGRPDSDIILVPSNIANTLTILVCINHLFAVYQLYSKYSMKGNA